MSAWVLPDHIADVLPSEARHIEELRRVLLDTAGRYGYELVIPPLVEHLESLLTGTGEALDLQTFKLVDQLSGRMLGVRADTTPQAARIDAHLLNRLGVARLCYCGPVLHTRPQGARATREPLQFGAELFGHAGIDADIEVLHLARDCLRAAGLQDLQFDLGDARIPRLLLQDAPLDAAQASALLAAIASKDASTVERLAQDTTPALHRALCALPRLFGDAGVLDEAARLFGEFPALASVLDELRRLAAALPGARITFDLADLRGYAYYSGVRFAAYAPGAGEALLRGGRYDEIGAVFGRKRPAVGFSLDLRALVAALPAPAQRAAVRAPGSSHGDAALAAAIGRLRAAGETVVCMLPGSEGEADAFRCDRELVPDADGRWSVRPLP